MCMPKQCFSSISRVRPGSTFDKDVGFSWLPWESTVLEHPDSIVAETAAAMKSVFVALIFMVSLNEIDIYVLQ